MIRVALVASLLLLPGATTPDPPVEETKKNIKVLRGMPASQLIPVMAFIANSLGVTCAHCHAAAWESDEKPAKDAARKMIVMQRALNEQQYAGRLTVTCNTCHRGQLKPEATPDVANAGWQTRVPHDAPTSVASEDALGRFPSTPAPITRRVVRGVVERFSGREEPKQETFMLTIERGKISYDTKLSHPPEASRALGIYVFAAPPADKVHGERWTVDHGDIVRRSRETPTPFGNLPDQIDYTDFRSVGDVRLPYRAQWSRADYRVTFTVEEITDSGQ